MTFTTGTLAWQGFTLIIAGSFCYALYVVFSKVALQALSSRFVIVVNMLGAGVIIFAVMLGFARPTVADWTSWPAGIIWPLAATALLNLVAQFSQIHALKLEDATLVAPMAAAAPVLAVFSGLLILREAPTVAGWIGIGVISIGSYILSGAEVRDVFHGWRNLLLPWKKLSKSVGVRLALLVALFNSISINFDKLVVQKANPLFGPAIAFICIGIFFLATLKKEHLPKALKRGQIFALIAAPIIVSANTVLVNASLNFGLASHSSALRRVWILFVVLLAAPLLGERGHPERLWGAAIMTAGAVLLAF